MLGHDLCTRSVWNPIVKDGRANLYVYWQYMRVPFAPHPHWHLVLLDFKILFNLLNENLHNHVVYIFISVVTNEGEHLSMCSLTTEIWSFVKCLIHLLLIFPSFFVFFLFICKSTLHIKYTCSLLVLHITFLPLFVGSFFSLSQCHLLVNKIYLF